MHFLITFFILFCPTLAFAYIGPGLAPAAIWMLFGPVAAILATIGMLLYFPLRYLYKRFRQKKELTSTTTPSE